MIAQGDICWLALPDVKPRPALVLVRNSAIRHLTSITVAPLTRTVRGIPTEVSLGSDDGLAVDCVATLDNIRSVERAQLLDKIGELAAGRWHEVCAAIAASVDC